MYIVIVCVKPLYFILKIIFSPNPEHLVTIIIIIMKQTELSKVKPAFEYLRTLPSDRNCVDRDCVSRVKLDRDWLIGIDIETEHTIITSATH